MTISSEYARILKETHQSHSPNKPWGTTGARNAGGEIVRILRNRPSIKTVLDFGAGQRTLEKLLAQEVPEVTVTSYDPGIPGIDVLPDGLFDFIVSTDVLEHIEPDKINEVVEWLQKHTRQGMFHHIACDPCTLILPDGRNAHLITEPPSWWREKFEADGWVVMSFADLQQRKGGKIKQSCQIQLDKL